MDAHHHTLLSSVEKWFPTSWTSHTSWFHVIRRHDWLCWHSHPWIRNPIWGAVLSTVILFQAANMIVFRGKTPLKTIRGGLQVSENVNTSSLLYKFEWARAYSLEKVLELLCAYPSFHHRSCQGNWSSSIRKYSLILNKKEKCSTNN